MTQKSLGPCCF